MAPWIYHVDASYNSRILAIMDKNKNPKKDEFGVVYYEGDMCIVQFYQTTEKGVLHLFYLKLIDTLKRRVYTKESSKVFTAEFENFVMNLPTPKERRGQYTWKDHELFNFDTLRDSLHLPSHQQAEN